MRSDVKVLRRYICVLKAYALYCPEYSAPA
uniref:Uncharacterized protein n=1 Tax=Anguilla anguilla TaxID=7936 RepID=A0A0E9S4R7_ANGAN